MKHCLLILCAFALFTMPVFAADYPVAKGAAILNGNLLLESRSNDGSSSTSFTFAPNLDYFVADNVFLGGGVSVGIANPYHYTTTTVGVGPEIGFAFGSKESHSYPYYKFGVMFLHSSGEDFHANSWDVGGAIGIIFPVHRNIGITPEFSVHLQHERYTEEGYYYLHDFTDTSDYAIIRLGVGISGLLY